ncbi:MAG: hexose kinase [Aggregatilineales bacterium]
MILCVTPNPAVDRTLTVPHYRAGQIFRPTNLLVAAGGKGINVARAIHSLGGHARCAGFLGGYSGQHVKALLKAEGIEAIWTPIEGETRTCTIIYDPAADQTTLVNEHGPEVNDHNWQTLERDVSEASADATFVCLSGSLPPGSRPERFADLVRTLVANGRRVWVDTSGAALRAVAAVSGMSLKINHEEASELLNVRIETPQQAADAASELFTITSKAAVITLGALGAVLAEGAARWHVSLPPIEAKSPVGSGDAFLGALLFAFERGGTPGTALQAGAAAGAANALVIGGGRIERALYQQLVSQTTLERL